MCLSNFMYYMIFLVCMNVCVLYINIHLHKIRGLGPFCKLWIYIYLYIYIYIYIYIFIVWRGVLTPLYCLPPFFKFCPTTPPPLFPVASNASPPPTAYWHSPHVLDTCGKPCPHCLFCCLVSLAKWVIAPHLMCYFT